MSVGSDRTHLLNVSGWTFFNHVDVIFNRVVSFFLFVSCRSIYLIVSYRAGPLLFVSCQSANLVVWLMSCHARFLIVPCRAHIGQQGSIKKINSGPKIRQRGSKFEKNASFSTFITFTATNYRFSNPGIQQQVEQQ